MTVVLLIFIAPFFSQVSTSFPNLMSNELELKQCINNILFKYARMTELILSVNIEVKITFPAVIYNEIAFSGYSYLMPMPQTNLDIYIIRVESNLYDILLALYRCGSLNPRGKFIILTHIINRKMIRTLFRFNIMKVVLITISELENLKLYEPKLKKNLEFHEIGLCRDTSVKLFVENREKINKINIAWLPDPPYIINQHMGISMHIIKLVATHLKLNMNLIKAKVTTRYGGIYENGTFTGIWEESVSENYDMFCGIVAPKHIEMFYFDITYPLIEDAAVFVLPTTYSSNGLFIFEEFDFSVWVLVVVSSSIVGIQFFYFSKLLKGKPLKFTQVVLIILQIIWEIASTVKFKSTSLRFLMVCYLSTTLILNTTYKSKLYKMSISGRPEKVITSAEDIVALGLPTGLHPVIMQQLKNSNGYYEKFLVDNSKVCDATLTCLNQTAFEKNLVTVKLLSTLSYYIPRIYVDEEGKSLIHIARDCVVSTDYYGYFFRKGHPLFSVFDKKLEQLKEGGFIDHVYKVSNWENKKALELAEPRNKLLVRVVTFSSIRRILKIYYISISICLIVFCVECWMKRISTKAANEW